MIRRHIKLFIFCFLLASLSACSSLLSTKPDDEILFTSTQKDYTVTTETIRKRATVLTRLELKTHNNNTYTVRVISQKGIKINASSRISNNDLTMPVSFICDYSRGTTNGELIYRLYRGNPKTTADYVPSTKIKINVICRPLTTVEIRHQKKAIAIKAAEIKKKENDTLIKKANKDKKLAAAKIAAAADEERRKSTPEYKQQQALNKQQKSIETSERTGYVNASLMHEAGSYVVSYEDVIKRSYKEYRQSGGKLKLKDIK